MRTKFFRKKRINVIINKAETFLINLSNNNKLCLKVLAFILVSSTLLKIVYVFMLTKYKRFIFADMCYYWTSAENRYKGDIFNPEQWNIFPPFYHIVLCELFKIINFFGLLTYKLEIVLFSICVHFI